MAFSWLAKKVVVPRAPSNATERHASVCWGPGGWLAVGGAAVEAAAAPRAAASGALRLLRLAPRVAPVAAAGAPPSVALERVLAGHDAPVTALEWNAAHGSLVSADAGGLVVVWARHGEGGDWAEELVNRRAGSRAAAVRWRRDGEAIVIAYTDGAVVVGSADGTRVWAKDDVASGRGLTAAAWSPDGQTLLFGVGGGGGGPTALVVYGAQAAAALRLLPLPALAGCREPSHVVAIEWWGAACDDGDEFADDAAAAGSPVSPAAGGPKQLAVCFSNGRVQLMRGGGGEELDDPAPVLLDTGLAISCAQWSPDGGVLAISGVAATAVTDAGPGGSTPRRGGAPAVQFYACTGAFLHTLELPEAAEEEDVEKEGGGMGRGECDAGGARPGELQGAGAGSSERSGPSLSWDTTGVRLAIAHGSTVYFATVRLPRWWAAVGEDALVAAPACGGGGSTALVTVLNTATGERHVRRVRRLVGVHGGAGATVEHFVLVCAPEGLRDDGGGDHGGEGDSAARPLRAHAAGTGRQPFVLILCDALGSALTSCVLDFHPVHVAVTATHVVALSASGDRWLLLDVVRATSGGSGDLSGSRGSDPAASTGAQLGV